jgi:hypothetical protein
MKSSTAAAPGILLVKSEGGTNRSAGGSAPAVVGCNAALMRTSAADRPLLTEHVLGQRFSSVIRSLNRAGSCGLHREGFHLVPLIAEPAAETVVAGKNQSVREYAGHSVASAFEASTQLSRFVHSSELEIGYKARADALYQHLGDTTALHCDILNYLTLRGNRQRTSSGFTRT